MEDENEFNEEQMPEDGAEEDSVEGEEEKKDDQEYEEEGVEEEDIISIKDRFGGIPMMKLPKEHMILQSYEVYLPSTQTENLLSEQNRKLFAEAFMLEETKKVQQIPRLADLCFSIFLKSFTGGNVDARIKGELRTHFGEALDINFPLQDITDLDIDSYWKKVFLMKCQDKLLVYQKSRSNNEDWKRLGIQEKFRELLETSSFEEWNDFEMRQLAKNIAPYIHELKILQLIPLQEYSIEKDPNLTNYKIYNYPLEDCHHINLELLGELTNLTSLHIEFQPPKIGYKYESRFFKFSYGDVENLATALIRLQTLKEFKLRRSRMDNRKLQILRKSLASLEHLELLDLSYNELRNDTGWTLASLLVETTSIKSLKLDGNFLGALGICSLFYGIQNYGGHLEYVSLARNLVGNSGALCIGRALSNSYQVDHLNLNGVKVAEYGAELIASLVKLQETALTALEICALPLGKVGGNRLIKSLYKNRNILKLECRACNLTDKQEYRIKILLMRNNYLKKVPFDNSEIRNTSEERQKLATDIDNWLSTTKHPVLLNVFETLEQQQECMETVSTRNVFVRNIPKFIPKAALVQKTNKELLFGEYYDTNVEDLRVTMDLRRKSIDDRVVHDMNNFNREDFLKHVDLKNTTIKDNAPYFNSSKLRRKEKRIFEQSQQFEKGAKDKAEE